ncbi:MAG: Type prenyl endopeptidase Rce1-like [Chloroflexota bacterium]|nr:Type prenyl endopeptidase Rce1-like [Chloroflexota bacterium]
MPNRLTLDSRLAAILIVGALGIAAFVHPLRPLLALGLAIAFVAARRSGRPANVLAAVVPVAAILSWGTFTQPLADPTGAQCADLFAPPAVWRFIEALVGLAVLALVLRDRGASAADIGLRLGSRRVAILAVVGLFVVAPLALLAGSLLGSSLLGESFFGTFALNLSQPAALAPALLFAASNALVEELAYRGAMRQWLVPALGVIGANLAQAIVFGLAHSGADFVGPVAPVAASMILVGFIAGVIARRTGSLTLLIAIHAAADIPIYFFWACRVA